MAKYKMVDNEKPFFAYHYTKPDKIDVDDDRLIELVKLHPEIYDTRHKQYLNSSRKRGIWAQIGKELDREPEDCKHRWVNIRDTLRKTLLKRERRRRRGITKIVRYKFEPQLGFLMDYFKGLPLVHSEPEVESEEVAITQRSAKSYKRSGVYQENTAPRKRINENSIDEFDEPMISLCDFPTTSNYDSPLHSETDNQTSDFRSSVRDPLESCPGSGLYQTDGRNMNRQMPTSTSTHPVDTFLAGIASTMKGLSPYFQNIAKTRIFQVVQSIELDQIKRMRNVQSSVDECDDITVDAECMEDQLPVQLMITKANSLSQ